ncbi:pyridoxal-phosphate-dependent aminotransferase family protein [Holdemania massiliensis]|uniref:pyridoxal-phosphate-dependent aminotransferase family protein n=1 Tax=Holdemania massiliensis TaxID=1468449 RepID=UPI001F0579E2|nr:aminotransferase class V-fold PLP-dependent enzyme [Holdemania massiliensis]MCH1941237.1 aminotransferase class V-fold PLP-dependent enzyme [Holdemania massiliensis]
MLNFTVGPVQSSDNVLALGSEQVPYFRTPEFSQTMFENERYMLEFANAEENSRAVFITGSGTASMEAAVMNFFTDKDKVLIIDGGSFGHRFVELCQIHKIPFTRIIPSFGYGVTEEQLAFFDNKGYTGFLVNLDETSLGVLYDINIISEFCRKNNIFLVVDSISSFLCDPFDMKKNKIQVMITGSQKALACPPGVSIIIMNPEAVKRVMQNKVRSMYFDLKTALKDGERGQTPFTPAVSILRQINVRLKDIAASGGVDVEIQKRKEIATDFRCKIKPFPFEFVSHSMSNAVTPLHPKSVFAYDIFTVLKNEYNIWVCPNGGKLKNEIFRVGHIGALSTDDNDILINAFKDLLQRKLI